MNVLFFYEEFVSFFLDQAAIREPALICDCLLI